MIPEFEPAAMANMREDGVTPLLLSISQHPEDQVNWANPVKLFTEAQLTEAYEAGKAEMQVGRDDCLALCNLGLGKILEQQAHIKLLRAVMAEAWSDGYCLHGPEGLNETQDKYQKALAIESSSDALKEHDTAMIEALAQMCESKGWYVFGDRIRSLGK